MPAIHSAFLETSQPIIAGLAAPSIKRGVPPSNSQDLSTEGDLIDEALNLFRPNCFAKSFDIRGPADRTLVYLLLYISDCLSRLRPEMSQAEAQKALIVTHFTLPGEAGFPLNGMFPSPGRETEQLRSYLTGLRAETSTRLLSRVYADDPKIPSRWWLAFQKRKFMNKSLS